MFESETAINQFFVNGLKRLADDVPDDRMNARAPGNGHPPVWILGHLAACAELGLQLLGQRPQHPRWLKAFGPGSSDDVADAEQYSKAEFLTCIAETYPQLCRAAAATSVDEMRQPHGVDLLAGTAIVTRGELVSHLLTSHLAFHTAQLSCWRRAAGHSHLF